MEYAIVPDVSKWNGPTYPIGHPQAGAPDLSKPMAMDAAKFKAAGGVGLIVRLGSITTGGVPYSDGRLPEIVQWAEDNDIPLGYYFYMRPKFSGVVQGNFIWSILQDLPFHLDIWLDVEEAADWPQQAADNVEAAAEVLLSHLPAERVGIYTSMHKWEEVIKMPANPLWPALAAWIARWNTALSSPWSDGKGVMRDWKDNNWRYHQYWADGNLQAANFGFTNGGASLDLSHYNGTVDDFKKYYGLLAPDAVELRVAQLEATLADLSLAHYGYVKVNEDDKKLLRERLEDIEKWAMAFPRYLP